MTAWIYSGHLVPPLLVNYVASIFRCIWLWKTHLTSHHIQLYTSVCGCGGWNIFLYLKKHHIIYFLLLWPYSSCSIYVKTFRCCYYRSCQTGLWSVLQESCQEESNWNLLMVLCIMLKSESNMIRRCFNVDGRHLLMPITYKRITSCSFITLRNLVSRFWSLNPMVVRKFFLVPE